MPAGTARAIIAPTSAMTHSGVLSPMIATASRGAYPSARRAPANSRHRWPYSRYEMGAHAPFFLCTNAVLCPRTAA